QSFGPAAAAFGKSLALRPDSAPVHIQLGYARSGMEDWDGAAAAFREGVRLRPYEPRAYSGLVTALARCGRHAEARQVPLALLQQHPELDGPRSAFRINVVGDLVSNAVPQTKYDPPAAEREAYRKLALDLLTAQLSATRRLDASNQPFIS